MSGSEKIKGKDLSYDKTLPPFLQRLKAQNAGRGDVDRHEHPIARPRRAKQDDEEDGPTVVDESGELLSKDDMQNLTDPVIAGEGNENVRGPIESDEPRASGALPANSEDIPKRMDSNVVGGTAQKKRKAAKVVGTDEDKDDESDAVEKRAPGELGPAKIVKKMKKKAKVHLSFDDGGDDG